jgi:hypothetical protein
MIVGSIVAFVIFRLILGIISAKAYHGYGKKNQVATSDIGDKEFWLVFFLGITGILILILKKLN